MRKPESATFFGLWTLCYSNGFYPCRSARHESSKSIKTANSRFKEYGSVAQIDASVRRKSL